MWTDTGIPRKTKEKVSWLLAELIQGFSKGPSRDGVWAGEWASVQG